MSLPRLHPLLGDPIESERCPDCGRPGLPLRRLLPLHLIEWGCQVCDADQFDGAEEEP